MKKFMFFVTAVCFSSYMQAQTDTSAKNLDEVIVTANRIEQKQSQTGKVVTVIGKEILQRSEGRTLSQVLNDQAGITINGALNNAGTVQTVFMRGASSGRVLILLDGIPVNDPSQINNEFDLNLIQIQDVERIEIARGAQSTLYGSDAVAGVINIITTNKDISKTFHAKAGISGGNLGTLRSNGQIYGQTGKMQYRLSAAMMRTDGFSSAYDEKGDQNFERDGYQGQTINASLRYQITSSLSIRTYFQQGSYKTDIDQGVFQDDRDFTQRSRNTNAGVGIIFRKKGISITGNYMYSRSRRNFLNDSISVGGDTKFVRDDYNSMNHFAELFASIELCEGLTLLHGADFRQSSYNNSFFSISSFGPFSNRFKDTSLSQQSMYASLIYNSKNQRFNLEIGGRLNVNSRYGSNYTYTFNPSYALSKQIRVFGSIATSFKTPGLYQLYDGFAGNPNLRPEESISYEAGIQHQTKKIRQRAVFFLRDIQTGIDFDFMNFSYYNIPTQRVRGIEYEASYTPFKGFSVTTNYTFLNGRETIQSRLTAKDTVYSYMLRRPNHQLSLQAGYEWKEKLFVSVNLKAVSDRFDIGGFQKPDVMLRSYALIGAYASYKIKEKTKLFMDLQNITGTTFFDIRGFNSIPFMVLGGVQIEL